MQFVANVYMRWRAGYIYARLKRALDANGPEGTIALAQAELGDVGGAFTDQ